MFSSKKKIKVMDIQGVISAGRRAGGYNHYKFMEKIYKIRTENKVSGVILRINSPGGSAGASSELAREIDKLNEKMPVLVSVADMCCSGGYMVASSAREIWVSPMGLVGSIGVIIEIPDLQGLTDKLGFKMRVIKSADMKDIGSPFRDMTENEKKVFQDLINDGYKDFVNDVLRKRQGILNENIDETTKEKKIKEFASGAIFTAKEAKNKCLIDNIGTFFETVDRMAEILEVESKNLKLEYEKQGGFLSRHLSGFTASIEENLIYSFFGMR